MLEGLKHHGGEQATVATFRYRYLYDDDGQEMLADPVLKGLSLEDRERLVATALLEYRDQGNETWERPHFTGYLKRIRDQEAKALPPPAVRYASSAEPEEELTDEQREETARAIRESRARRGAPENGSGEEPAGVLARSLGPEVPETIDDPTVAAEREGSRERQLAALRTRMGEVRP